MNGCMWMVSHKNCVGCPEGGDEGGCDLAGQDYSTDRDDNHENYHDTTYSYDDTTGWGGSFSRKEIKCRNCKVGNLYWKKVNNKWKLFDYETDKPHICDEGEIELLREISIKENEIKQLKEKRKLSIQKEQLLRKEEVLITIDQIGEFTVDARQLYEIIFKEQNKTYNW